MTITVSSDFDGGDWRSRAADAIPGGSSTGSKRPDILYGTRANEGTLPTHYQRAEGSTLWAPDGRKFVDFSMALGAVAIGYADPAVTRSVITAVSSGSVTGLPHVLEVEVAERIIDLIPCGESVRFLRTGAEANAAAIRIARVATGRTKVLGAGYFGWLDWCSEQAGVPDAVREDFAGIPFDDTEALSAAIGEHGNEIAAIIVEPLMHHVASEEWLRAVREACDRTGAVMIMDEIKTAFRIRTGGVQELTGVMPDLTTIGKALANGFPLAAVTGRSAVMDAANKSWISSTAAAESSGLAAAKAVCEWHDRIDVPDRLSRIGQDMQEIVAEALTASPWLGVTAEGPYTMWRLTSEYPERLDALVACTAREGVLLKRGAYQFACLAHDQRALDTLERVMASVSRASAPVVARTNV